MQIDERAKKAADLVADNAKQLITVAAGVLTFTVTFYEKLKPPTLDVSKTVWFLVAAWAAYLASIWYGFRTIDALAAHLEDFARDFTVFNGNITKPALLQRRLFLVSTALILI